MVIVVIFLGDPRATGLCDLGAHYALFPLLSLYAGKSGSGPQDVRIGPVRVRSRETPL